MTNWQEVRLGDVCIQITDGTHNTVKDCESGDCYLLSCKNIKNGNIEIGKNERKIDRHTLEKLRKRTKTAKGDVLLSSVGTIGETAVIKLENPNYEFQRSVAIFKPNLNFITSEFLYYSLNSRKDILQHSAEGAVQQCLFITPLKDFPISLPPIDVQKKIAGVLGALDDKIELNNRINNNLEQQAQALFKSWFVDFEPFGGVMPEDWKEQDIYNIANIIYGAPFASKLFNTEKRGKPIIRIRDLKNQYSDTYTEEVHPKAYIIKAGNIVVGMDGEFRPYIWGNNEGLLNQRVCVFENKRPMGKMFLYLTIKPLLNKVEQTEVATTVIHIGKQDFDAFKFNMPVSDILDKFDKITSPIYDKIVSNSLENTRLAALRDTLLPKLMSGEIDVDDVKID